MSNLSLTEQDSSSFTDLSLTDLRHTEQDTISLIDLSFIDFPMNGDPE